ncbi:DUF1133 family protein, partial [Salmonella enterica subsp. enterica serovar Corvallis]|nr:DUF1133 family protein [Salmonella enterica subsp. enterica serovar Corvallis]
MQQQKFRRVLFRFNQLLSSGKITKTAINDALR